MPRESHKPSSLTLSIISSPFSWFSVSTVRVVGLVGLIGFLVYTLTLDQYTEQPLPGPLRTTGHIIAGFYSIIAAHLST